MAPKMYRDLSVLGQPSGKNSRSLSTDHSSTFGLSSIPFIKCSSIYMAFFEPCNCRIAPELCAPAIDRTFKIDESVPQGPTEN